MKFGKSVGSEIEMCQIDRVLMSETELRDLQMIEGPGCWAICRNGREVQIRVSQDPEPLRIEHKPAGPASWEEV
jgi:hypothetical protein